MTPSFLGLDVSDQHPRPHIATQTLYQEGEALELAEHRFVQGRPRPKPPCEGVLRAGVFAQAKQARGTFLASPGRPL